MISSFPVVDTEKLKEVHDHEASHGVPFTPEECREACWRPGEGWGEKKVLYVLEESSTNESGYAGVQRAGRQQRLGRRHQEAIPFR